MKTYEQQETDIGKAVFEMFIDLAPDWLAAFKFMLDHGLTFEQFKNDFGPKIQCTQEIRLRAIFDEAKLRAGKIEEA